MLPAEIDHIFPFIVFFYGALLTACLSFPALVKLAEEKFTPELYTQMRMHRGIGLVCLVVGSLWILQSWFISR